MELTYQRVYNDILPGFNFPRCNFELRDLEVPNEGKGILATVSIDPYLVVATCYGKLFCGNLSFGVPHRPSVYQKDALVVLVKAFLKWVM